MIRNKKVEIIIVACSMLFVVSYLLYTLLCSSNNTKINNFKRDALSFCQTVMKNNNIFSEKNIVFLEEVIDEGLMTNIKSPFSSNLCDSTQSKVVRIDNSWFVTLKCDDYLLDNVDLNYVDDQVIYKVSDWTKKENDNNSEQKVLYNCIDKSTNKPVTDNFEDEFYLLYKINKKYGTEYNYLDNVSKNDCNVVSNKFIRTKSEIEIENRS